MKILYIDEGNRGRNLYLEEDIKSIGNHIQCVVGVWDTGMPSMGPAIRKVEKEGPNNFAVPQALLENPDAEIIISQFTPYSAKGLDAIPACKIIGCMRGGLENVDVKSVTDHGILLINAGGYNAYAVSEYTVGMILAEMRSIARSHHATLVNQRCHYQPQYELHGKTIGLVGFGFIGKLVAKELSGFDTRIITYDPFIKPETAASLGVKKVEKDELFAQADVVCMHARLSPATYHMVGAHEISLMKPTAYLINTARAGLVDTEALTAALQKKKIAGCALDVYDEEPLPADSPLMKLDNVTLTPHRAGATYESSTASPKLVCDRIKAVISGEKPAGVVNPEVLQNPAFLAWLADAKKRLE